EWCPDLVFCHGLDDDSLEEALLNAYPCALYAHTYYGTCISGRKCYAVPSLEPCNRHLGHSCLLLYYPRRCGGLNPKTMWKMFRRQTHLAEQPLRYRVILVASEHMRVEFERHDIPQDRLQVLRLPAAAGGGLIPPAPTNVGSRILFVGRLMDVKGAD